MIRTLVPDVLRYGDYSRLGESIYDHPFQWGSKRTGPDLARVGGKYPNVWHLRHMEDPRSDLGRLQHAHFPVAAAQQHSTATTLPGQDRVQRMLGVPYPQLDARADFDAVTIQSKAIAQDLRTAGAYVAPEKEIIALIAYLQHLGQSESVRQDAPKVRAVSSEWRAWQTTNLRRARPPTTLSSPFIPMFRRLLLDDAAAIFTFAAFITAASIFTAMTWRALRMRRPQIEHFESLPFATATPPARHDADHAA